MAKFLEDNNVTPKLLMTLLSSQFFAILSFITVVLIATSSNVREQLKAQREYFHLENSILRDDIDELQQALIQVAVDEIAEEGNAPK